MGILLSGPMLYPCSPCASRHPYPSIREAMRAAHHLPHSLLGSSSGTQGALGWWVPVPPSPLPQAAPQDPSLLAASSPGNSALQLVAHLLFRLLLGRCPRFGSRSPPSWRSAEPLLSSATAFGTAPLSCPLAKRCGGAGVLVPFAGQTLAPRWFKKIFWAQSTPTLKTRSTPLGWERALILPGIWEGKEPPAENLTPATRSPAN